MIKATLAFATGCILILVLPTLPAIDCFWSVILNILLFLFKPTRYLALILTAALWTYLHCLTKLSQQLQPNLIQQNLTLTGVIDSIPKNNIVQYVSISKQLMTTKLSHQKKSV